MDDDIFFDGEDDDEEITLRLSVARRLRLDKGLSQKEAGGYAGVSQATVAAIEAGKRATTVYEEYLIRLGTAPNSRKRTPGGTDRVGRKIAKKRKRKPAGVRKRR